MSLYSDLNEVLTPYANKIKGLAQKNTELKADLGAITTPERLAADTDLNDITTPGVYALHSSLAYDNIPEGDFFHNGFLEVYEEVDGSENMTRIFQRITLYPVEDAVMIWARYYSAWHDFGWSEWFRVESDMDDSQGPVEILEGNSMTIKIKNVEDKYSPEIAYVEILPQFANSGSPSMDNIINFTGHTSGEIINVITRETASTEVTETNNFPYDWSETAGTVYHGILDLKTGRFTVDGYLITIDETSDVRVGGSDETKRFTFKLSEKILIPNDVPIACNMFPCVLRDALNYGHAGISMGSDGQTIWFKPEYGTAYYDYTAAQMKTFLGSHPLKVVFRLATPTVYNFNPSGISIRYGTNVITSDCGNLHIIHKEPTYDTTLELITKDSKWIFGKDVYIRNLKSEYPTYGDDDLLDLAITRAIKKGKNTKIIWDGTDIHFSGEVIHTCSGFGGIDFNGSKIYMPDYDNGTILEIVPDSSEDVTASAADFTSYKTINPNLQGKVFTLNNNTVASGNAGMCLGVRAGRDYTVYWSPTVITNKDGLFATDDLYLTPLTGDVICWNVHDLPENTFTICNGIIVANATENMSNFMHCKRSNVKLSNFILDGRSSITIFHVGVFTFRHCCEIEVDHIYGINPATLPTSGYAIGLFSVTNAYVHDCSIGDGLTWGALGANHLMNTVFERCNLSRWDCHYAQTGYNVIRECKLNQISYGVGNGTIVVENCEFAPDEISDNEINLISHRGDMPGAFDGDIIIRGCTFKIREQAQNKINILMDGSSFEIASSSAINRAPDKRRIVDNCQFPDGCNRIFVVGSTIATDEDVYSKITYAIRNCVIGCADSVIDSLNSVQTEVGGIVIENCEFENQCYITKALTGTAINIKGCKFENVSAKVVQNTNSIIVSNSELSNIVSDSVSAKLIATGNNFTGAQSVSSFTDYALAGNIASDMESVNKHS